MIYSENEALAFSLVENTQPEKVKLGYFSQIIEKFANLLMLDTPSHLIKLKYAKNHIIKMYLRHLLLIIPYVIGFIMVTVKDKIWGVQGILPHKK